MGTCDQIFLISCLGESQGARCCSRRLVHIEINRDLRMVILQQTTLLPAPDSSEKNIVA